MGEQLRGNQFWKLRTVHRPDKLFGDGALLWEEACKYFDWCDRHPWLRAELVKYKGDYEEADVPLGRPYTLDGLTVFLGVSGGYFRALKSGIKTRLEAGRAKVEDEEILATVERIEQTVRTQQIEGAAVGVFNSNLISRINNIAENLNANNTGEMVFKVTVRDQETADNLAALDELL